jgi:outer membrane protein assembly factor BamA
MTDLKMMANSSSGHTLKSAVRHILCVDRRDNVIFPSEGTMFK